MGGDVPNDKEGIYKTSMLLIWTHILRWRRSERELYREPACVARPRTSKILPYTLIKTRLLNDSLDYPPCRSFPHLGSSHRMKPTLAAFLVLAIGVLDCVATEPAEPSQTLAQSPTDADPWKWCQTSITVCWSWVAGHLQIWFNGTIVLQGLWLHG